MKISFAKLVANAIWFQLCWWLCVLYENQLAPFLLVASPVVHQLLFSVHRSEWGFLVAVTGVGFVMDSLLGLFGVLVFADSSVLGLTLPPLWLITLWFVFSTTLHYSVSVFLRKPWLFIGLCGFGGTISYVGGSALSSIELALPAHQSIPVIALAWTVSGSIIYSIYHKWTSLLPSSFSAKKEGGL